MLHETVVIEGQDCNWVQPLANAASAQEGVPAACKAGRPGGGIPMCILDCSRDDRIAHG